jgi:hypothetical protein
MTAFDLIDSIFARAQPDMPANVRRISPAQLDYLESLIAGDCEAGAYKPYGPGVMAWMPAGCHKYLIAREGNGRARSLTRLSSLNASATGRLF